MAAAPVDGAAGDDVDWDAGVLLLEMAGASGDVDEVVVGAT